VKALAEENMPRGLEVDGIRFQIPTAGGNADLGDTFLARDWARVQRDSFRTEFHTEKAHFLQVPGLV
jgi:hypothetical protein